MIFRRDASKNYCTFSGTPEVAVLLGMPRELRTFVRRTTWNVTNLLQISQDWAPEGAKLFFYPRLSPANLSKTKIHLDCKLT